MSEDKVKSEKVVDVVYIMDERSKRKNLELLFSLRSVKKHLKNFRKIHIFGSDMTGVIKKTTNVKHHKVKLFKGANNQIAKHAMIDLVCQNKDVSEDFILISDDCFMLEDQDANKMPTYYSGTLTERVEGYRGQKSVSVIGLFNTNKLLRNNGHKKDHYFNTHSPLPLNKKKFLALRDKYYIEEFDKGLIYKSLYCNTYKVRGRHIEMKLVYKRLSQEALDAKLNKAPFFAVHDSGLTPIVINYLAEMFHKPLSWEK